MRRFGLRQGFTMIELLVVIVILGVLAAAMVPAVGRFLDAGDDAASRNNLMRLGRAALAYKGEKDGCYPAAGGWFTEFQYRNNRQVETRYGRAAGWVYFEHDCPRKKGDVDAADEIGSGNANSYGFGEMEEGRERGDAVNEEGICLCFNSKSKEGGIGAKPAEWRKQGSGSQYSLAEVAIMNGCLFPYTDGSLKTYVSDAFIKRAVERTKGKVKRNEVVRAYAMNIITGTDSDLYDVPSNHSYAGGGPYSYASYAIRYGQQALRPYVDNDTRAEAMPTRTALFVELDVDDEEITSENSLAGDQVWDWDKGNESMGFIHDDNGARYAHVCFADGHVEAIRDPSADSESPDKNKRRKLSKWYGSGGRSAEAEKLD